MIILKLIHLILAILSIFTFVYRNSRKNAAMLYELQNVSNNSDKIKGMYLRQRKERIIVYSTASISSILLATYLIFWK